MQTIQWPGGGIPVGYLYNEEDKVLVLDTHFSKIVRLIYDLAVSQKMSPRQIAEELNKRNIKSRRGVAWSYKTVAYLFTPAKIDFYSGYQDGVRGNWDNIISASTAAKLKSMNIISQGGEKPRSNIFLLPGLNIAYCGHCGGPIKSSITPREDKTDYYYLCTNKQMRGGTYCPDSKLVRQNVINEKLIDYITELPGKISSLKKYTEIFEQKLNRTINADISRMDDGINSGLSKQRSASTPANVNVATDKIVELVRNREEIILKVFIVVDWNIFKNYNLNNFSRYSIENQRLILPELIHRITVYSNYALVDFRFGINPKGINTYKIEY